MRSSRASIRLSNSSTPGVFDMVDLIRTEVGIIEGTVVAVKETLIRFKFEKYKYRPHLGVTICNGNQEIDFVMTKEGAESLITDLNLFFELP